MSTKQQYEVVWVDPATLQRIHHQPKKALFKEISHAVAFAKCMKTPAGTFTAILPGPVAATISEKENSTLARSGGVYKETEYKWEVVGRSPDDYTITHMVFPDAKLGFKDHDHAKKCADFINEFPNNIRRGLIVAVVAWKPDRHWQPTIATELNTFI